MRQRRTRLVKTNRRFIETSSTETSEVKIRHRVMQKHPHFDPLMLKKLLSIYLEYLSDVIGNGGFCRILSLGTFKYKEKVTEETRVVKVGFRTKSSIRKLLARMQQTSSPVIPKSQITIVKDM